MGISVFPAAASGSQNFDFVVDMNDTTNNVIELGQQYAAGAYSIALSSGDTSYDVYFVDENGATVGYGNDGIIVADAGFETAVILGVSSTEVITFTFAGAVSNASSQGDEPGAGAYLVSISPFDLPDEDDTATVTGGNFGTAIEINFTSGTVTYPAKNIVRNNSTQLVVTRPDGLISSLNPWNVVAVNPGVPEPTGTNAHILSGTVIGGSGVAWVTTSPLATAFPGSAYSVTLEATDPDGAVTYAITAGTFPGLSLNSTTGVLSGTATGYGSATVTATDAGNNTADRDFEVPFEAATGGIISTVGNYIVHTFNASGDFVPLVSIGTAEYIILGGGGGGGERNASAGGGGGGGLLSSIATFSSGSASSALSPVSFSPGTATVTIGAGGATGANQGSSTILAGVGTAVGGGHGGYTGNSFSQAGAGGSGGGAAKGSYTGGLGTTGQGQSGGSTNVNDRGGGGGGTFGTVALNTPTGGLGTHNFLDERGWGAGGGAGVNYTNASLPGGGSSGNDQSNYAGNGGGQNAPGSNGAANFGGGGGGASTNVGGWNGGSGKVVIRYEKV